MNTCDRRLILSLGEAVLDGLQVRLCWPSTAGMSIRVAPPRHAVPARDFLLNDCHWGDGGHQSCCEIPTR
jgi:hypothetical protein